MRPSVITSASMVPLDQFAAAVNARFPGTLLDLFFLRDQDLMDAFPDPSDRPVGVENLFRLPKNGTVRKRRQKLLEEWIYPTVAAVKNRYSGPPPLAAFATYAPWISSNDDDDQRTAKATLIKACLFAMEMAQRGFMERATVEFVSGPVDEPCRCAECTENRRVVFGERAGKSALLLAALRDVLSWVKGECRGEPILLGVELEPGGNYLFGRESWRDLLTAMSGDPDLQAHVGLNLDVSHMVLAGVRAADLEPFMDRIVHAHVSDHPGMHIRDFPVGRWTDLDSKERNKYDEYFDLLKARGEQARFGKGLPFSNAIAVELEGCNRMEWVFHSLAGLNKLLERHGMLETGA